MYYFRGLSKKDIVDFLYDYLNGKRLGFRILKKDLRPFSKVSLAAAQRSITDGGKLPWKLINKLKKSSRIAWPAETSQISLFEN